MEPTLHGCTGCTGDRIYVDKLTYDFSDPHQGDVVVFKGPDSWDEGELAKRQDKGVMYTIKELASYVGFASPDDNYLVKRIIATEGQTVSCQPGDPGIMVDGKLTDSSFTLSPMAYPPNDPATSSAECQGKYFGPITVPDGNVFVMGDNRTNSADSRYHLGDELQGTIPVDNIDGKVRFIIYPFNRIGGVSSHQLQ